MKPISFPLAVLVTGSLLAQDPKPIDAVPAPAPITPNPAIAAPAAPVPEMPAAVPAPPKAPSAGARSIATRNKRIEVGSERGGGGVIAGVGPGKQERIVELLDDDAGLPRTTRTARTLVIRSTDVDPAALANAEEDLSVMALILRKATGAARGEDRRVALGIEVDNTVFGSSSGARNLYVEGYGAIFLLSVRYPLIAPKEEPEEKEAKTDLSNDWAQAREEYLGAGQARFQIALDSLLTQNPRRPAESYESEKVEKLKTGILQALKNASHIRVLKPNDFITVVIQGAEASRPEKSSTRASSGSRGRADSRAAETVMTVRVKTADAGAVAKGTLDLDGLRKRAVVQTYLRRGDSSVGTAAFTAPARQ